MKKLLRFPSNAGLDTMAVQAALSGRVGRAARPHGLMPIIIDTRYKLGISHLSFERCLATLDPLGDLSAIQRLRTEHA